jgi:hypothetical protein
MRNQFSVGHGSRVSRVSTYVLRRSEIYYDLCTTYCIDNDCTYKHPRLKKTRSQQLFVHTYIGLLPRLKKTRPQLLFVHSIVLQVFPQSRTFFKKTCVKLQGRLVPVSFLGCL